MSNRTLLMSTAAVIASIGTLAYGGFSTGWQSYGGSGQGLPCGSTVQGWICGSNGLCDIQVGLTCAQHCRYQNGVVVGVSCDDDSSHP
jgi:hypothetical protein